MHAPALNQSEQDGWLSHWTISGKGKEPRTPATAPAARRQHPAVGVWHLFAAYELARDKP